jgi:kinesin family member 11
MDRIAVAGRIRPQSRQEVADEEDIVLRSENRNIYLRTSHAGAPTTKTFKLDCVLPENSTQVDVFNQVHPLLKSALTGINCSIFAYGQTGTGKTHTMLGYDLWKIAENESVDLTSQLACDQRSDDRGIIPRSMEYLFNALKVIHASANSGTGNSLQCMISASYVEIYNEKIIDLLDCSDVGQVQPQSTFAPASQKSISQKPSLEIRNTKSDGVVIPGLTV